MPSNDERREVAARLREANLTEGKEQIVKAIGLEGSVASRFVAIPNLISVLNFDHAIVSFRELADRLADLIEPEPERTCRVVRKTVDLDGELMTDYTCCFNQPGWNNNFCPNCGSKVVSDDATA